MKTRKLLRSLAIAISLSSVLLNPERGAAQTQPSNATQADQTAEYARVFDAFRGVQELRSAVPRDAKARAAYLNNVRSQMAVPDDIVSGVRYLLLWNHAALDASAMDHNTLSGSFGEQFGPTRTSRALAIVHLAIFEAINTISRKHPSYQDIQKTIIEQVGVAEAQLTPTTASIERSIVEAAYQTLSDLYPKKSAFLIAAYQQDLTRLGDIPDAMGNRPAKMILGELVGGNAARAILTKRKHDKATFLEPSVREFVSDDPGIWHQDPISKLDLALGGNWHHVKPFVIASADAFRPGGANLPGILPPAFDSPEFIEAYKEVKRLGGDPNAPVSEDRWPTPTVRTGASDPNSPVPSDITNQTLVGIYFGYDGTALLCAPPRLYNMIATSVALGERPITNVEDMSQYLAYINVAMADAGIAAWDAKYHFLLPRPITYLRTKDADETLAGKRDPRWTPLGAPVTNGSDVGRNLSPPFPAYPSGHATFGGALFKAMTLYFQAQPDSTTAFPDEGIAFDFVSDEYNGLNRGPGEASPRGKTVMHFDSFNQAQDLNARSRIYLGIHWQFDADHGIIQGNKIAEDIFAKFVKPMP